MGIDETRLDFRQFAGDVALVTPGGSNRRGKTTIMDNKSRFHRA
jgi:hypothetical protein